MYDFLQKLHCWGKAFVVNNALTNRFLAPEFLKKPIFLNTTLYLSNSHLKGESPRRNKNEQILLLLLATEMSIEKLYFTTIFFILVRGLILLFKLGHTPFQTLMSSYLQHRLKTSCKNPLFDPKNLCLTCRYTDFAILFFWLWDSFQKYLSLRK